MFNIKVDFSLLPIEEIAKGTEILTEGKNSEKVYVLKEGKVSISCGGNEICQEDEEGTFLGEISKLLEKEATATVTTIENSSFYIIHNLKMFSRVNPAVAFKISEILAERLVKMNELFKEIKTLASEDKEKSPAHGKIYNLIVKFDNFLSPLDRDVFGSFSKSDKKTDIKK